MLICYTHAKNICILHSLAHQKNQQFPNFIITLKEKYPSCVYLCKRRRRQVHWLYKDFFRIHIYSYQIHATNEQTLRSIMNTIRILRTDTLIEDSPPIINLKINIQNHKMKTRWPFISTKQTFHETKT